jgi:VWFA-related protein
MRRFAWGLAWSVVFPAVLLAQSEQRPAVFRSGVDLVRFDLSVVDADGTPLTDVRPDEIEIVEDGQRLPVVMFQRVQEPAGFYTEAALRAVSAEVTTNDAAPRGHLYVLVFDQQHITPGNEARARDAAAAFIRTRVRASDRVAVFAVPGPGPDLQFTADTRRAIASLDTVRGSLERTVMTGLGKISQQEAYEIAAGNDLMNGKVLQRLESDLSADVGGTSQNQAGGRAEGKFFEDDLSTKLRLMRENAQAVVQRDEAVTRDFLARLANLLGQFKSVEGRKTVVLFSEGFHSARVSRDLQDVAAAAAESYSVVYAMDLNRRLSDLDGANGGSTSTATETQERTAALANLALETNGTFVSDASSHLDQALTAIADRSQDYYIAGFLPSEQAVAQRGSYRRVTVRVKRPGARVSARTGYSVPANSAAPDRRGAIDAALAAPFSQQALKIDYTTYVIRSETTGHPRVVLSLDAELPLADQQRDRADVVFVVRNARDGRIAASGSDTIALPDTAVPGSYFGRGTYRVQFEVPAGAYLMRAVVREPGGLLGSADRRLDVRNVAGPAVAASDLVLRSGHAASLPVRSTAYIDDGLAGGLEVYGRTPEQLNDVTVRITLAPESGGAGKTIDAALADTESVGGGTLRRASFVLPLGDIAPGNYIARATVTAHGEELAAASRQLSVVRGAAPAAAALPPVDPHVVSEGPLFRRAQGEWVTADPALASHAQKGLSLFASGDYAAAASELETAFDASQGSAGTAFVLGWAWEGAGEHRKAIGAWRAAALADPALVPAHLALAEAYLRLDNSPLAVQALRAGLAAAPESVELKAKLAQITGSKD